MFNIALAIANEYNLIKKAIPKTGKSCCCRNSPKG